MSSRLPPGWIFKEGTEDSDWKDWWYHTDGAAQWTHPGLTPPVQEECDKPPDDNCPPKPRCYTGTEQQWKGFISKHVQGFNVHDTLSGMVKARKISNEDALQIMHSVLKYETHKRTVYEKVVEFYNAVCPYKWPSSKDEVLKRLTRSQLHKALGSGESDFYHEAAKLIAKISANLSFLGTLGPRGPWWQK